MGTIETKIHQLQELSRQQKNVNKIKQDIADILGNTDMEEKKKIAEQMSKMEYENMNQARNLQFIVPNLVKELYDHEGPKWEFVIPKNNLEIKNTEPTIETIVEPTIETKIEKKQAVVKPIVENFEQEPKPKEKTESEQKENNKNEKVETEKANEWAWKVFVVPWFDIQKPVIETEETKEEPAEQVVAPVVEQSTEPIVVQQPKEIQPEIKEEKTESIPEKKEKKTKKPFKLVNIIGIKTREQKIQLQKEKIEKIKEEKKNLRKQAWNILEKNTKYLSESAQELLKSGLDTGEIKNKDILSKVDKIEVESFYHYAKELMIKVDFKTEE